MNTGPTGGKEWSVFNYFLQWSSDTNRGQGNMTTWYSRSKEKQAGGSTGTRYSESEHHSRNPQWIQEMD